MANGDRTETGHDGRAGSGDGEGADSGYDEGATSGDDAPSVDDGPGYECPFCGSTDTERESAFGSEVSAEQHYCHGCHTVFERMKYDGRSADAGRRSE